ncbi:protein kinase [Uliginosibacterium sp. 31-16]|uniref:serine/threonine protein kinase n=1 Tax=Uliginosibacterium sp. 31-16 TaxID=3068315 RepID=UPI00273E10AC|nr:serine/threonine protein kinase [Uliginosibacterium sp. 31-16]MDP5240072.1 protein kinase [Uliginosibacterium sp. 31-16]
MTDSPKDNNTVVLGGAAKPGATRTTEGVHNALPVGTRMGEFEIIGLVGEGGFGIVYLAQDHSLERKVALKEYMPASLAARGDDASVIVRSERHQETFEIGRRSFVNEARLLAQFDHPALVKVYRFWEANSTAYMAMPYYDGQTLRDALRQRTSPPDEAWLKKMLDPVTEALGIIHEQNCFHRDIAPDNIMLLRDGRPVLLDFGAARRVISDMTQALTVILKPGYAPIEQYAEMPGMKQGAWTDIYALAAVCYFAIARKLPPPSVSRIVQDSYEPLAEIAAGRYSNTFLRGIDHCLAVKAEHRPQTMAEMRELIGINLRPASTPAPAPAPAPQAAPDLVFEMEPAKAPVTPAAPVTPPANARPVPVSSPPVQRPLMVDRDEQRDSPAPRSSKAPLFIGIAAVALAAAGGGWYYTQQQGKVTPQSSASSPQVSPTAAQSTPLVLPPPPGAITGVSAPVPVAVPAPPAASSETIEAATPPKTEPKPEGIRLEPVAPATQPAKKPAAKPVEPKPKPAKPAGDNGDKAERDYMKQLNKDLDNLLR